MKTKINVKLLRKVQRTIVAEPLRVDMTIWAAPSEYSNQSPPCGAVGCIAGWAMLHVSKRSLNIEARYIWELDPEANQDKAAELLSLSYDQARRLFISDHWPTKFKNRLAFAKEGTPKYARVVSDRIDHFIKTRGAE